MVPRQGEKISVHHPEGAPSRSDQRPAGGRAEWFLVASVLAFTFAAYAGTLLFDFAYDDDLQIILNPLVHSWKHWTRYFTGDVWSQQAKWGTSNYYRPLFLTWFRIDDALFKLHPMGWHLTTVAVHLAVTLAVYRLALKVMKDKAGAFVAAMIFGLHPVHVESVAWISGVTDPLLAVFLIPSLICFIKWSNRELRHGLWFGLSLALYEIALFEKETGLILPILIFGYEWIWGSAWREGREGKPRFLRRGLACFRPVLPFLAATIPYLAARSYALHGLARNMVPLSFSTIIYTWPENFSFYIWHFVWPLGLSAFYSIPLIRHATVWNFVLPLAGVLGVASLLRVWWRRVERESADESRAVRFACVLLVAPILPLLDLRVFPYGEGVHDRYLYLPSVGFAMLVALGLRHFKSRSGKIFGVPAAQMAVALPLAFLLGVATNSQEIYWANDFLVFSRGVQIAPRNTLAVDYLGRALGNLGQYQQALRMFWLELRLDPDDWTANFNLGHTYYLMGDVKQAEARLRRSISTPGGDRNQDGYFYLGLTLMKEGRIADSVPEFRKAIQLEPSGHAYHFALGLALEQQGDLAEALREFKLEEKNYPGETQAVKEIKLMEGKLGQPQR